MHVTLGKFEQTFFGVDHNLSAVHSQSVLWASVH